MKILFPVIAIIALQLLFTGCVNGTEDLYQIEPPPQTMAVETTDALDAVFFPLDVKVTVVNSHDYFELSEKPDDSNKIFRSYDELRDFIGNTVEPNYVNGIPEQFYTYDEDFFKSKVLCYSTMTSATGSVQFFTDEATAVKTYKTDGTCVADIRIPSETPEICTDDMAYFCFFAELDKDDLADDNFELHIICGG